MTVASGASKGTTVASKAKFNVGDRVRLTKKGEADAGRYFYDSAELHAGDEGIVINVKSTARNNVEVDWGACAKGMFKTWWVAPDGIELVSETKSVEAATTASKFAVGDRVRLTEKGVVIVQTEGDKQSDEAVVGTTGTLLKIDGSSQPYLVRIDVSDAPTNGFDDGWWVPVDGIEIFVEPTPSFSVGDKVRINRWGIDHASEYGYENHSVVEGMTGVVRSVSGHGDDADVDIVWDRPNRVPATLVRPMAIDLIVSTATATPVSTPVAVTRITGAEVEGLRFVRQGDNVTVLDSADRYELASMSIEQLRAIVAILDGCEK